MLYFQGLILFLLILSNTYSYEFGKYELSDVGDIGQPGFVYWLTGLTSGKKHWKPQKRETLVVNGDKEQLNSTVDTPVNYTQNDPKAQNTNGTTYSLKPNNDTKGNITVGEEHQTQVNLSNEGVITRGLIVFGGFTLLAIAYLIFYRRKRNNNVNNTPQNASDNLQFRYGVLQSNEGESHVPLTMESDDEDDDDLQIFDFEQTKKSSSYVNLKLQSEDDLTHCNLNINQQSNVDKDLLLDIDDRNVDTLINFTGTSSK